VTAFPASDLAPAPVRAPAEPPPIVAPAPTRKRSRWHRAVIPLAVLVLFWAGTLVAHAIQTPSLSNPGTMSPTGTGPDGSSLLAAKLRDSGVTIVTVHTTKAAIDASRDADGAAVFVPEPAFLDGSLVDKLTALGQTSRVVLVRPGLFAQAAAGSPFIGVATRWASKALEPGCGAPVALAAGRATAYQDHYARFSDLDPYAPITIDCYQGGLVGARVKGIEIVYVGATDPFRNSRFDEAGNAALATGLLSGSTQLIWLDIHSSEVTIGPVKLPPLPSYHRDDQRGVGETGNSTIDAFPPLLWATLALLALGALLLAIMRARRLGPPVAESLPVVVPAAEAITGRGRLYRRVHARQATLDALRAAAIARIARVVYRYGEVPPERDLLTPGPAAEELVATIAARTSDPNTIRSVLYGHTVETDEDLEAAVASLDALVAAILRHNPSAAPSHPEETT
jgi:hypothetical protein